MTEQDRTYITMADKSIGKCSSGHWLPLNGNCDLCGAGPGDKCLYTRTALAAAREAIGNVIIPPAEES